MYYGGACAADIGGPLHTACTAPARERQASDRYASINADALVEKKLPIG